MWIYNLLRHNFMILDRYICSFDQATENSFLKTKSISYHNLREAANCKGEQKYIIVIR